MGEGTISLEKNRDFETRRKNALMCVDTLKKEKMILDYYPELREILDALQEYGKSGELSLEEIPYFEQMVLDTRDDIFFKKSLGDMRRQKVA